MNKPPIFITGIGTGIGKTVTSAVVVEKLKADYWKPVQSGDLHDSDSLKVQSLVSNPITVFYPETYRLTEPYSPHKSAKIDGITIDPKKFVIPQTTNHLVIEGAGGLMVPLNDDFLIVDLIKQLGAEVILVSQNYLGSINHTLLSVEVLHNRNIPIKGIMFNGIRDASSEEYIATYTDLKVLGFIPQLEELSPEVISSATQYVSL